jgi:hypothetical protein
VTAMEPSYLFWAAVDGAPIRDCAIERLKQITLRFARKASAHLGILVGKTLQLGCERVQTRALSHVEHLGAIVIHVRLRHSMASTYASLRQRLALRSASAMLPAHSARL